VRRPAVSSAAHNRSGGGSAQVGEVPRTAALAGKMEYFSRIQRETARTLGESKLPAATRYIVTGRDPNGTNSLVQKFCAAALIHEANVACAAAGLLFGASWPGPPIHILVLPFAICSRKWRAGGAADEEVGQAARPGRVTSDFRATMPFSTRVRTPTPARTCRCSPGI
jgi:hypothetical protein